MKAVVVVAGGKGLRMGAEIPKQFLLLRGKPVLMYTLEAFYRADDSTKIILVLPEEQQAYWQGLVAEHGMMIPHTVVAGGETRFHSVRNGLKEVDATISLIAVHDGVRPLVSEKLINDAFDRARQAQAVYPAIEVTDTLRRTTGEDSVWVDRALYHRVQTPQVFGAALLLKAYGQDFSPDFTDDISVVEMLGEAKPQAIAGSHSNIKITTPTDLLLAEALLKCPI